MFISHAYAEDWKGNNIRVSVATLMCDYFHMEKALILQAAGNNSSIQAYKDKEYCAIAPKSFYATVVEDTSTFSDNPMVEVVLDGVSTWVSKGRTQCCYAHIGGKWEYYGSKDQLRKLEARQVVVREADRKTAWEAATTKKRAEECAQAKQHLTDLKGAGLVGTAQYKREFTFVGNCAENR